MIWIGPVAVVTIVLGGVLGYASGQAKAFELRLQAQTALCQVSIERNTSQVRPAREGSAEAL